MNTATKDSVPTDSFVVSPERNWTLLCGIPVWMVAWVFVEILVGKFLLRGLWSVPAELQRDGWWASGGMILGGLLLVWFLGWTAAGLLFVYAWAWYGFGYELVSVDKGELVIKRTCLGWQRTTVFNLDDATTLRIVEAGGQGGKLLHYMQPPSENIAFLTFVYRQKAVRFGSGITKTSAAAIVSKLQELHPALAMPQSPMMKFTRQNSSPAIQSKDAGFAENGVTDAEDAGVDEKMADPGAE